MDKLDFSQLQNAAFRGKTVFMVHLKQEKQYWESIVPGTVEVRTSHSLGFQAVRKAYQISTPSVNQLKVAYMLDRLIPDEPDTDTQHERLMELIRAIFQRSSHTEAPESPATEETPPKQLDSSPNTGQPTYRDVVFTLTTLAKKEACLPHELRGIESVLEKFTPYYNVFRTKLDKLDRKKVIAYVEQGLELSLPKEGVLEEYDFADQIWLPAIFDDVPLARIDTLLIEVQPGFYEAEKRMLERWGRNGTRILEVEPEPPPKRKRREKPTETQN